MNYRDRFYSKYISTHTRSIYGDLELSDIEKQFPAWRGYFGKFLPDNKEVKILDVGCGNGGFVYWLQEIGYKNASGIDISKEQIELAGKIGIKNVSCADIKEFLRYKKEFYDIIFARDVIEHFSKDEILEILDLIFQSLKKGGKVIIQAPNAENLLSGRLRYGDFTHEISFTADSMRQILSVVGFNDIEIIGTGPIVHGVKSFIRYILWHCVKHCLSLYLLIETGSAKGIFSQNLIASARK